MIPNKRRLNPTLLMSEGPQLETADNYANEFSSLKGDQSQDEQADTFNFWLHEKEFR